MSDEQDWAEKIAIRILNDSIEPFADGFNYDKGIHDIAKALREARKIEWPDEDEIKDKISKYISKLHIEDGTNYTIELGFRGCFQWLKSYIEERRK